jgi:choline dehydrogenase
MPSDMSDPAFLADAIVGFNETPARGPYTLAGSNSASFVPLSNITADYQAIVDKIKSSVHDGSAASYLPADYRDDPTMVAGYEKQLAIIAKLLADPHAPSVELPFATGTAFRAINLSPPQPSVPNKSNNSNQIKSNQVKSRPFQIKSADGPI